MKPTYLYIKQHSVTGKLYFGKTKKDPDTYTGSGTIWSRHLKVHGREYIMTIWYCLFHDEESIKEFALMCSEMWNIVKSNDWLNLIPENGLDGNGRYGPQPEEEKRLRAINQIGRKFSIESKKRMSDKALLRVHTPQLEETKKKIAESNSGKTCHPAVKQHLSDVMKKKYEEDPTYAKRISKSVTEANLGKIWINLDEKSKFVTKEKSQIFLDQGWLLGRAAFSRSPTTEETKEKIRKSKKK
jgi:hypothetical protein